MKYTKCNFSENELVSLINELGRKLSIRINRAGNLDVIKPNRTNPNEHFVLYLTSNNRYLWRRWFSPYYCYPLNMKGRKRIGEIHHGDWGGTWYNRAWDIRNCEFDTVDEAITYFKGYMKKYHNINL